MASQKKRSVEVGVAPTIRFNIMVVGESGIGKTTMLKTIFKEYTDDEIILEERRFEWTNSKTVKIESIGTFILSSASGDCKVHLFDSPGYGDFVNNQTAIDSVRSFLINAHEKWVNIDGNIMSEQQRNDVDERIHCIFYFIAPHRMKDIDETFIKELYQLGPIIPVVGKSDTMTIEERKNHLLDIRTRIQGLVHAREERIIFDFEEDAQHLPENYFQLEDSIVINEEEKDNNDHQHNSLLASLNPTTEVPTATNTADINNSVISLGDLEEEDEEDDSCDAISASASAVSFPNTPTTTTAHAAAHHVVEIAYSHAFAPVITAPSILSNNSSPLFVTTTTMMMITQHGLPRVRNIFAIVSDTSPSGKRIYPWGEIDIHNENHSDFRRLQRLLLERSKIVSLKTLTQAMSMELVQGHTLALTSSKKLMMDNTDFPKPRSSTWIREHIFGVTEEMIASQKKKKQQLGGGRGVVHSWILLLDDWEGMIVFINELFVIIGWLAILVMIFSYVNLPDKVVWVLRNMYTQIQSLL